MKGETYSKITERNTREIASFRPLEAMNEVIEDFAAPPYTLYSKHSFYYQELEECIQRVQQLDHLQAILFAINAYNNKCSIVPTISEPQPTYS